ncbi:MAG: class I SAM-dependent methyltransferase [Candidatus Dormibacteria bacterium]
MIWPHRGHWIWLHLGFGLLSCSGLAAVDRGGQAGWGDRQRGLDRGEFDRRALSYDQSAPHRWQAAQAARFLAPRRGVEVLDVATGTGLVARALAGWLGSSGWVVGIDLSVEMLRRARRVCDPGMSRFVRADAQVLPFRGGVFDAVVCVAAVPYFPDPEAVLAEWRRVCRPGGQVVFTVSAPDGITTSRLLCQAAALEGIGLDDPGGPLADPERRDRVVAATGWTCEESARWSSRNRRPTRGQPSHSPTRASVSRCE